MQLDQLDSDQQRALDAMGRHLINKEMVSQHMLLSSFAGAGKSFTIKMLLDIISDYPSVSGCVAAFTGRASSQLSKSGIPARTIHSILLKPITDYFGNLIGFEDKTAQEIKETVGDFIIIDEASMVNSEFHTKLTAIGVPILYAGDAAQLPPIDKDVEGFNLMEMDFPTATLSINHRQKEGSGIRELCDLLRRENTIPRMKREDLRMVPKSTVMKGKFFVDNEFDVVVCGTNRTRKKINNMIRFAKGFDGETANIGEQVVCLQNSITPQGVKINNGELYTITGKVDGEWVSKYFLTSIDNPEKQVVLDIKNECWESEYSPRVDSKTNRALYTFGFGYCLSAHKIQGSTVSNVLFIDEDVSYFLDQQKFRYTAISRASEHLTVAF